MAQELINYGANWALSTAAQSRATEAGLGRQVAQRAAVNFVSRVASDTANAAYGRLVNAAKHGSRQAYNLLVGEAKRARYDRGSYKEVPNKAVYGPQVGRIVRKGGRVYYQKSKKMAKRRKYARRKYYGKYSCKPHGKIFDTAGNGTHVSGNNNWTNSNVGNAKYIQPGGTEAAYTNSALIPSAVGSGQGQVIGSSYAITHMRTRMLLKPIPPGAVLEEPVTIRMLLVLDTQPNGTQENGANVMETFNDASTICSFQRMETARRFKILRDKTMIFNSNDHSSAVNDTEYPERQYKTTVRFKKPLQVGIATTSSTPTVASLTEANIFWLMHTEAKNVSVKMCNRVYYYDA